MKKVIFALGGANCLHDDLTRAKAIVEPDTIIATNHAGKDYGGIVDHWCSMHPEKMNGWVNERTKKGLPPAKMLWRPRHKQPHGLEMQAAPSWGGSSGLLAVTVGLLYCEATHIIVCGMPYEPENAHYDDVRTPWSEASRYRASWNRYFNQMRDRVRSMSGWTRQLLGEPDERWLNGDQGTT